LGAPGYVPQAKAAAVIAMRLPVKLKLWGSSSYGKTTFWAKTLRQAKALKAKENGTLVTL
jgi:hypothetical protein